MALNKSITSDSGVVACYWRIAQYLQYFPGTHFYVNGYVSEEYRELEKPVCTLAFDVPCDLSRQELYGYLKTLPEFEDAIDV